MADVRTRLLERLRSDAWRRGTFRLASGRESDFFIDCKQVALTAEGHHLVGEVYFDALDAAGLVGEVDAVAGVALGGCPLASAVALTLSGVSLGRSGSARTISAATSSPVAALGRPYTRASEIPPTPRRHSSTPRGNTFAPATTITSLRRPVNS